jgi:hypothetical protein
MVIIDNVYQKVLALANKEQRGYITPQEFNLFANQAQLEIFEQYFYDINQFGRTPGNENEYGDMLNLLNEKVSEFKTTAPLPYTSNVFTKPNGLYRIGTVWYSATALLTDRVEIQEITTDELMDVINSPLVTPTVKNPVYIDTAGGLEVYPTTITSGVSASYITLPTPPRWGYVVISEKAMFDPSTTTHFELHPAEETELVYKILKYAGISMDKDSIMRAGQGMEVAKISQEKQ